MASDRDLDFCQHNISCTYGMMGMALSGEKGKNITALLYLRTVHHRFISVEKQIMPHEADCLIEYKELSKHKQA